MRNAKCEIYRNAYLETFLTKCFLFHLPFTIYRFPSNEVCMKLFTELYIKLDQTNKTNEKVDALKDYFGQAKPENAAWALYFLSGRKPKQIVPSKKLKDWAMELSGVSEWLFEESRNTVGDTSETIALLLPENHSVDDTPLNFLVEKRLLPLRKADEETQFEEIVSIWNRMNYTQRFIFNKLIAGNFRIGVSQRLVMRALAEQFEIPVDLIALRLMGNWEPTPEFFESVINPNLEADEKPIARPYPFHLAYQVDGEISALGKISEWQIEWKYDGIRCQAIKREGQVFLWSRGEDLITERFPEIAEACEFLPDGTVLDGEILPFRDEQILQFQDLQRRIGRKTVGKKLLAEVPVILKCYDLLEFEGRDFRSEKLEIRREILEQTLVNLDEKAAPVLRLPELVVEKTWEKLEETREQSRSLRVEGFMLKRKNSPYRVSRHRGDWWKWKIDPFTVDAVLIYAQKGTGRRADLFTDYTFAVWQDGQLVPFAKAYSGLTDKEIRRVDNFVRRNTKETFGPVRSVTPKHVFELAFEGIQKSNRHKSGVAVRFPRILRWREDKKPEDADSIETIHSLLDAYEAGAKK